MKINVKIALGALMSLLLFSGCQKDRADLRKDPLDENYKLIDRGDYALAIQKLQTLSKKDFRPQVRITLASAYAARAGIRVEQYWGFLIGFNAPLVPVESLKLGTTVESLQRIAKQVNGEIDPRELKVLGGLVNALSIWERYKERIDSVPTVQGLALEDIKKAVEILSSVQTPGGRLYRAILNLILFKSYAQLSAGFWEDFNDALERLLAGDLEVLCQFDFQTLEKWLTPISYHLMETLADLSTAFPENQKEMLEAHDLIQSVYSTTIDAIAELRKKRLCQ